MKEVRAVKVKSYRVEPLYYGHKMLLQIYKGIILDETCFSINYLFKNQFDWIEQQERSKFQLVVPRRDW